MGTRRIVVGVLGIVLFLGGCAQAGSGPSAAPGDSMSATPAPSESSPPPRPLPSGLSLPPSQPPKPGSMTLTGLVERGVEHGCLVLNYGGKTYQLMGGDPNVVYPGAQVQVSGRIATDIRSYCMQGIPFQVSAAHPA